MMTERNGGIWPERASVNDKLVFEEYDAVNDAFTLIWQRASDGYFEPEYLVKAKVDPQWRLPFWENVAGHGIYESQPAADSSIRAFADEYLRNQI